MVGSGCGSVGRAVASNTRGPRFESSHRQKKLYIYWTFVYCQLCIEKTKKEKEAGNGPFLKKLRCGKDKNIMRTSLAQNGSFKNKFLIFLHPYGRQEFNF